MINYSFIIPHKDVPKLLERCIHSIPLRADVEIIVVDDNSTDKSELCKLDCLKKQNVQLICLSESRGAGKARNEGLRIAKGKWLLFADADDFYTQEIDKVLEKYATDSFTDIVYLNAQNYFDNGSVSLLPFNKYIKRYLDGKIYSEEVLRYNVWTPWTRMVKKELVLNNNIRFEEIPVGNDKIFCLECSRLAKNISAEPEIVYNYYVPDKGSLTYTYCLKIENLLGKLELQIRTNQLYEKANYKFKSSLIHFYISSEEYAKTPEARRIYRTFFKDNSISYIKDIYYLIKQIFGKITGIL